MKKEITLGTLTLALRNGTIREYTFVNVNNVKRLVMVKTKNKTLIFVLTYKKKNHC